MKDEPQGGSMAERAQLCRMTRRRARELLSIESRKREGGCPPFFVLHGVFSDFAGIFSCSQNRSKMPANPHKLWAKNKSPHDAGFAWLVEPRGVEPLSESTFTVTSPGAVCRLGFPPRHAGKQAYRFGRVMLHDGGNSYPVHVHH